MRRTTLIGQFQCSLQNLYGTCNKWKYSHWGEDPEDQNYCDLRDSPGSTGPRIGMVSDYKDYAWIFKNQMLVGRDNHYYVRNGGLDEDFETAFNWILDRIIEIIGEQLRLPEEETVKAAEGHCTREIFTLEDESAAPKSSPAHHDSLSCNAAPLPSFLNHDSAMLSISSKEGLKKAEAREPKQTSYAMEHKTEETVTLITDSPHILGRMIP